MISCKKLFYRYRFFRYMRDTLDFDLLPINVIYGMTWLRRYDATKTCRGNFSFELFIIGKFVKFRFKNKGSPCYFLSSRGQKTKNITNIKQKKLLLLTFFVSFFMAFLVLKLIYAISTLKEEIFKGRNFAVLPNREI